MSLSLSRLICNTALTPKHLPDGQIESSLKYNLSINFSFSEDL